MIHLLLQYRFCFLDIPNASSLRSSIRRIFDHYYPRQLFKVLALERIHSIFLYYYYIEKTNFGIFFSKKKEGIRPLTTGSIINSVGG